MSKAHTFDPTTLREYDVRGIIGKTLGATDALALGRSFGTLIRRAGGDKVAVGYDGRLSSPMLEAALVDGLMDTGCSVTRVGIGPTPMLYYAVHALGLDGGVMITGSHNPPDYNGFKMLTLGGPFYGKDILGLGALAAAADFETGSGREHSVDIIDRYVDRLLLNFDAQPFRIAWDPGNGAAGDVMRKLAARLPGEHVLLNCTIDGTFPAHHPDPTEEKNLVQLREAVLGGGLDFGIAFDGDGDRIGAIDGTGRVIWGDQLLQVLAADVLTAVPGATIIADVKASQALFDRVAALGGVPLMWRTGHSLIKAKLKETKAPLAGEMSGHVFFNDRWFGFDDGLYTGARLLEILSRHADPGAVLEALPNADATPELHIRTAEGENFALIDALQKTARFDGASEVITIDGVRVEYPDGFGLARASNTTPVVVTRFEADDAAALARIQQAFRTAILAVAPDARIPF